MRIVGGAFGGRRFNPPTGIPARPTTDVAKEGLFNTLENMIDLEGISTCDLFGGTGSISYELASRGAARMRLIERDPTSINFIIKTAKELDIYNKMDIIRGDVFRFIKGNTEAYDFIFAGPPYALATIDEIPALVTEHRMLNPGGVFVLEHTPRNNYERSAGYVRSKNYGTTIFSFFQNDQA
jgi:16S rRNA (guanine(966)-N(2))-methyltransferase RsmD